MRTGFWAASDVSASCCPSGQGLSNCCDGLSCLSQSGLRATAAWYCTEMWPFLALPLPVPRPTTGTKQGSPSSAPPEVAGMDSGKGGTERRAAGVVPSKETRTVLSTVSTRTAREAMTDDTSFCLAMGKLSTLVVVSSPACDVAGCVALPCVGQASHACCCKTSNVGGSADSEEARSG